MSAYLAVIVMGLVHGLEPGHGWPVAALFSIRRSSPLLTGFLSGLIIAVFHFISSLAVVLVFLVARTTFDFSAPWIRYIAAAALLVLAYRMWQEHGHGEKPAEAQSLWSIAVFAFGLGFAHEEEFALLALAVGGINPWLLMSTYATAVTVSLVTITLIAVKTYTMAKGFLARYDPYLPKVTAGVLVVLALLVVLGWY